MRLGVTGDTHGNTWAMRRVADKAGTVNLWLHTGDFQHDAQYLSKYTGFPSVAVAGNCDGRSGAKPDEFLELCGYMVWMTHGHCHGVKHGLGELHDWAVRYGADIVIYGHSHVPGITSESGILFLNPGSPAVPRGRSTPAFALVDIQENRGGIAPVLMSAG
jgi:putative phosphoesterase